MEFGLSTTDGFERRFLWFNGIANQSLVDIVADG
jgi:hypothetical protein